MNEANFLKAVYLFRGKKLNFIFLLDPAKKMRTNEFFNVQNFSKCLIARRIRLPSCFFFAIIYYKSGSPEFVSRIA